MTTITATDSTPQLRSAGLAILRIAVGIIFLAHGAQKIFEFGMAGVAGSFGEMGIPLAGFFGPAVSLLEFLGGIALILGLLTRPVAVLLAINMLSAFFLVHLPAGFFLPNGYEFVFALFAANVALALMGPGAWSVDAALANRRSES